MKNAISSCRGRLGAAAGGCGRHCGHHHGHHGAGFSSGGGCRGGTLGGGGSGHGHHFQGHFGGCHGGGGGGGQGQGQGQGQGRGYRFQSGRRCGGEGGQGPAYYDFLGGFGGGGDQAHGSRFRGGCGVGSSKGRGWWADQRQLGSGRCGGGTAMDFSTLANAGDLTKNEVKGILSLREEEKLARDVYKTLNGKWNHRVFSNVAQAEQRHMDRMKGVIEACGLEDPIAEDEEDEVGNFANAGLQGLYDELVAEGTKSLPDAFLVGAKVEEMDIEDLEKAIAETDSEPLKVVYQNLRNASFRHLRAFARNAAANVGGAGTYYRAQHLPQDKVDAILN